MPRPKHPKPDACQAEVVRDLRALGRVVWVTSDLGGQVTDLVVFWDGCGVPVEVKSPGGTLTPDQRESIALLRGVGVEAIVAGTAEEVLEKWPKF
jgi:hypothetical protein